ncbi:ATP-grasp domain-containing protein [Microvirga massiliensis]|uniref:ATP-grasp domain-containing protein n=1 Tax=Microvirga massiliensis TaxID=1033741 RepID=UPI0007C7D818|nr:ATP-grasp domain-containing protein [Microvirga massiliensis]
MPTNSPSGLPADGGFILLAAQSGRALAAAARRAGLRPLVADLFGDTDTRALAEHYRPLRGQFGFSIDGTSVLGALEELVAAAEGEPIGIVLGSGFEAAPDVVETIASRFRLFGAGANTLRILKDPIRFAAILDRIGIQHPAVSLGSVADPDNWLAKRAGASGGTHIGPALSGLPEDGTYYQRRVVGEQRSFAFLADGRCAQVFAVTAQWTSPSVRAPHRFGGGLYPGACPPTVMREAKRGLDAIVAETGLQGLASADCLVDGENWWLLEVNPRPGATLDVLDRRTRPLLLDHIEACLGRLPPIESMPRAAATTIVYASRPLPDVPVIDWPDHVFDRPEPGSRIPPDGPVCTVFADGDNAAAALDLLDRRVQDVRRTLRIEEYEHGCCVGSPERERACCAAC